MARGRGDRRIFFNADRKNGKVLAEINGAINERIRLLFDLNDSSKEETCPGETECGKFRIAVSEVGQEKAEESACTGCRLFPTKYKKPAENKPAAHLINRLEVLRQLRLSGYPPPKDEMTVLEFETLIVYDMVFEHARIQCENTQRRYLEENLKMSQHILKGMFR